VNIESIVFDLGDTGYTVFFDQDRF